MTDKKKKKKSKHIFLKILGLLIVLLLVGFFVAKNYYEGALEPMDAENPREVSIVIPSASTTDNIIDTLYQAGLIKNPLIFKYEIRSKNVGNKLKAGEYTLSTGMDTDTIIDTIVKGVKSYDTTRFTIPEGYEVREIADRLEEKELINKEVFLELTSKKENFEDKYEFLKELDDEQNLEGFLFPSTYEIYIGASEEEIIEKMLDQFEKIYNNEIKEKSKDFDLSLNQIVTLASIIEREGKLDNERPIMSGVFHNRLEEGMLLQSCATVQYILGERKPVLSNKDTSIDSPFNTYINTGLPPSPIASPGKVSLVSAVNPADVEYKYFVLTGRDGSHTFSVTLEEHNQAKKNMIRDWSYSEHKWRIYWWIY